jgi:S1-C subfamily serine protease
MNIRRPRPKRGEAGIGVVAVLASLAVLALAGCGSSSQSGSSAHVAAATTASTSADELQQQFRNVVRTVSPEVVQIQTNSGLGSGVVFDGNGDIVTNAHVVTGAQTLSVTLVNGNKHPASIVGIYPQNDIAVIRVSGAKPHPPRSRTPPRSR